MGNIDDLRKKEELILDYDINFEDNVYYKDYHDLELKEGPYCSCCFDFSDKLVRLHECIVIEGEDTYNYICPKCKTKVNIEAGT